MEGRDPSQGVLFYMIAAAPSLQDFHGYGTRGRLCRKNADT